MQAENFLLYADNFFTLKILLEQKKRLAYEIFYATCIKKAKSVENQSIFIL